MRTMGIALQKNFLRFSIMEGTKNKPLLINKGRLATIDPGNTTQLMDWYETTFQRIIHEYKPTRIGYKLTLEPTIEQIHNLSFPLGILNLLAYRNGVEMREYSVRAIKPKRLGLPQETDLYRLVDETIGEHPPYWDSTQKDSILVAWFCL